MMTGREKKLRAYGTLLILATVNAGIYGIVYLRSGFYSVMQEATCLTHTQMGNIWTVYGMVASLSYIFGGRLADTVSGKKLVLISAVGMIASGCILMLMPSYPVMLLTYGGMGVFAIFTYYAVSVKIVNSVGRVIGGGRAFGLYWTLINLCNAVATGINIRNSTLLADRNVDIFRAAMMIFLVMLTGAALLFALFYHDEQSCRENTSDDKEFYNAFGHTLLWTLGSVTGQVLVGFTGALCLNQVKNRIAKSTFRIMCIIPWAFPAIATAMVWKWILNGIYGFFPTMLVNLGITDQMLQFFSDKNLVMPTLMFINIWFGAPLILVNVYAALQTIPQDQYEAAQIDGASKLQSFIHITMPHIRTVVGLLVVLRTVWVFNNFDIIYMITGGGPAGASATMPIYIYDTGWTGRMVGKASAASIILLLFLIILCVLYFSVLNRWEKEDA